MVVVAFIFILFGYLITNRRMYWLIAGYNTLPKEEQAKIDIIAVAAVFRNAMYGMAIILLVGWIVSRWLLTDNPLLECYFLFGAIIIGIPYLMIEGNFNRYLK